MGGRSYQVPISAKGIIFDGDSVWLRKNERNEWELPGGKVDQGEQPSKTIKRELQEELGFKVEVLKVVHAWMYTISGSSDKSHDVLVLLYLCRLLSKSGNFETEGEAGVAEFRKFTQKEIKTLKMPRFYKDAIQIAWNEFWK